ncbi:MAG: enoyl-CoA hydratase/isomerase family protein [Gammaproteobacteria bacterium]|nr:enoyl-CoA hydratase/isomerase family protein [Gammaproteobacteria bacterium]
MTTKNLLVSECDGILTLTINRPEKRNALRMDLLDQIGDTLTQQASNEQLRLAVITAAGDRCFAAGGDLQELDAIRSVEDARAMSKRGRKALDAVRDFPLPVAAAMNGLALGGGAELAMACDLRVAAANAEIGFLQGQLGVTTAWGGGIDLIAAVGSQNALDLLLSARRLKAEEALAAGLFTEVCGPEESFEDCVNSFIKAHANRSRQVLLGYKALTKNHRMALHENLRATEEQRFVDAWTHEDHWTAVEQAAVRRKK